MPYSVETPPVDATAELDAQLIEYGYEPIACIGKRPVGDKWQKRPNTIEAITAERTEQARNIGIRTGRVAAVDIDLRDDGHVGAITRLAYEVIGAAPLERTGSKASCWCTGTRRLSRKSR